ncbi:nucleotidyl transferase AbiEii/AbiGii toxin family protein [Rivihabitans pingtungensis]|uniref:nucleotidyl transferase AbiEii/AbiGii toxin family protein n=1 Tax=Rivihabitans pingtungensis TaxID=1054498 RepID=UPI00357146B9
MLAQASKLGFVLYGGTAIALRLGHRESVDFDFFSDRPLDRDPDHAAAGRLLSVGHRRQPHQPPHPE